MDSIVSAWIVLSILVVLPAVLLGGMIFWVVGGEISIRIRRLFRSRRISAPPLAQPGDC